MGNVANKERQRFKVDRKYVSRLVLLASLILAYLRIFSPSAFGSLHRSKDVTLVIEYHARQRSFLVYWIVPRRKSFSVIL
jgi:hypothetical protein